MRVNRLVDTGALHLCFPEHVALQAVSGERDFGITLADGLPTLTGELE